MSEVEFVTLREALEVSDSVLSKHVSALAGGRLRRQPQGRGGRAPHHLVSLTKAGDRALRDHVAALRALIEAVD